MIIARETIYAAFWAQVSGLTAFKTKSRRLVPWSKLAKEAQPALYMQQHQNIVHQTKGVPPSWSFLLSLFVYDHCGNDANAIPGQRLNALLDVIDTAFAPNVVTGRQTLGGLVSHCWMVGPIEYYEGYETMMNQSVLIIPFEIKVPDASGPV